MNWLRNRVWSILLWLGDRSTVQITAAGLVLSLLIGLVGYRSQNELSVSILFVLPVAICSWVGGRWSGTFMAIVSTLVWMAAQHFDTRVYYHPTVPFLNAAFLLASFLVAVFLISSLREAEHRLEDTVARRTAALKNEVSERQRAQELLGKAIVNLMENRHELARTLGNLQQAHAELQTTQLQLIEAAKLESVGRLAAGVAHEVKNPLMAISMSADYLGMVFPPHDESAAGALKDIKDAVKRAGLVIGGLLDYASTRQLQTRAEDLNLRIESAVRLVKHTLIQNHITLKREMDADLPLVVIDPNKMEQVFVNVLLNAIHAMPKGGTMTIRTRQTPWEPSPLSSDSRCREGDAFVIAEIDDTGTGIPEQNLSRIFDPFFTTKQPGEGTGLGLSVVRQIVKLHDGNITINNREEGGARVAITLKAHSFLSYDNKTNPGD